jgi:hypothetical protein
MMEDEIFEVLHSGTISIKDRRVFNEPKRKWLVTFKDDDICVKAYGSTREAAWDAACETLKELLSEREVYEQHPSLTPGERNPSMNR